MKQCKQDTCLNERDALQDMLDAEKQLLTFYSTALTEGSCQAFRKQILKNYSESEKTQFSVFEQMLARGYYEVQPAEKMLVDKQTENFSKVLKQLAQ